MTVVCVGLATRDTIWQVPEHPPEDGRVVATDVVVAGGGPAATAAVALSRLGIRARFVGAVGDDDAGSFVRHGLAEEGVDVSHVRVVPGARTPQSAILVGPSGARSIVHHPGDATFELDAAALEGARYVHVDHVGYSAARTAVAGEHALSVDGGNPIPGLDLQGVAIYAPTEEALRRDFGDARAALDAGARLVVVTRGADGSSATTADGETVEAAGVPCDDAVSTLGAGDVFHGALLAALVREEPLADALAFANRIASLSCRALDGRSAIPLREELS
jgi:sugar/nucleoside kinase (ribokinase family)